MLSHRSSLAELPDPRAGNTQRHNFLDVLTISKRGVAATLFGAGRFWPEIAHGGGRRDDAAGIGASGY